MKDHVDRQDEIGNKEQKSRWYENSSDNHFWSGRLIGVVEMQSQNSFQARKASITYSVSWKDVSGEKSFLMLQKVA